MNESNTGHPVDPKTGDIIAGKYELERLLGAGGMGTVFAAKHLELDRRVAVKFVHSGISDNPEIAARFLREARAVVRIESEHVAKVIDVGHMDDGTPFMVMEYLEGQDLSELLESTQVEIEDAVDYVVQACSAMDEAHHMGIVHRDLKPANLFLTHRRDGTPIVKVLDFGISKFNEPEPGQEALTNPAVLMGSPAYMSPEQLRSARDVDHRSDIWSLGVILFELLAGRPAFDAESLPLLMTCIMRDEPASLLALRPTLDPGLAAVVAGCLVKDVAARFQTMAEMANALLPFAPARSRYNIERLTKASGLPPPPASLVSSTVGNRVSSRVPPPAEGSRGDETDGTWVGEPESAPRSSRRTLPIAVLSTVVILVGLVVGGIYFVRNAKNEGGAGIAESVSASGGGASPSMSALAPPAGVSTATPTISKAQPSAGPNVSATTTASAAASAEAQPKARAPAKVVPAVPRHPKSAPAVKKNPPQVIAAPVNPRRSPRPAPKPRHSNPLEMDLQ